MARKIKVLYVSAECSPYSGAGGLGEVAGALPGAIAEQDIDIRRIVPLHRETTQKLRFRSNFPVKMGDRYQTCLVKYDFEEKEVPTYFVGNDYYFNRDGIYKQYDDGERFLFFCKAVVGFLEDTSFKPDIIHINDWHAGMIPMLLKSSGLNFKTVNTIHNLIYNGWIGAEYLQDENLPMEYLTRIDYPNLLNFMKAGIIYSDVITTVSSTFAGEMQDEGKGFGMEELLREKGGVIGILNGVDAEKYNPVSDSEIYANYSHKNAAAKKENKKSLQREFGLDESDVPIISAVTRLEDQKGIDILIESIETFRGECQFVILGSGRKVYEDKLLSLCSKHPGRIAVRIGYSLEAAKKIYAGSDIYVMPSLYEPGGMGQLIAMRYGTVPVVRGTGGLRDTVEDFEVNRKKGTGFLFERYSHLDLNGALEKAVGLYNTPEWSQIVGNCMKHDVSWKKAGKKYADLYREIV
ncbi:MAG: glycogen synthase [Firmicutes bacterium]|nr:glycogen synthase [Bacillota bacterium]